MDSSHYAYSIPIRGEDDDPKAGRTLRELFEKLRPGQCVVLVREAFGGRRIKFRALQHDKLRANRLAADLIEEADHRATRVNDSAGHAQGWFVKADSDAETLRDALMQAVVEARDLDRHMEELG